MHACPWGGGERWSRTVPPVVATELRRETDFSKSLVLSCAWDFCPPPPILFIRFVWQEMASCELLLTQKRCPSCSPNHLPSQLLEQAHCRYCLVLSLRGSSGFPKWCVHLLSILLLHLEWRLDIIPKLALLGPSPPVTMGGRGALSFLADWSRGIYPSSLYHNSAGLPILCCFYSLGTEQAMHLMKVWHCLCPCQSCRQAGVCSSLQPLRRSSGLLLQGFASRSWLVLFWAQPATCAQSLYIVHILQTCLLSLIWQPCEGEILHLGFMRFLLFSRFLLGSFSHIYEEINRGSIWVVWKCIYHLLPSAT